MGSPKTKGRMINKSISNSKGFASLSPEAAVLFTLLIPFFNSHGKINGGPGYIKDEVCPLIPYLSYENIPNLLKQISDHTNVKHFKYDGRWWIHSINFLSDHQNLDINKLGEDLLPSYSGVSQELVVCKEEEEEEVEGKKGTPELLTPEFEDEGEPYATCLGILSKIPGYPFDRKKDVEYLKGKADIFPDLDLIGVVDNFSTYLLDKPLEKNSKPRAQLLASFEFCRKYGKHLRGTRPTEQKKVPDAIDRLKQHEKEFAEKVARGEA